MLFRQLFDAESSTYTYLLADPTTREAVLIDAVREQIERDLQLISELALRLVYVVDTHTHADHITGAGLIRKRTGAKAIAGARAAPCADIHVRDGDHIRVAGLTLRVLDTPGHTDDSVSLRCEHRVFTGDALMIRAAGRTDFQSGSAGQLFDSITGKLFALPDDTLVYPAHDYHGMTVSTIGEEKRFNARIAGRSREEFIAVMEALHLPAPKKLAIAVPANRACGLPGANVMQG